MKKRLSIIFITSLLLIISISFSQDDTVTNLLENGDFEGNFVELDGADPRNVAESWTPWHIAASDTSPSFANHNPNYDEETDRIRLDEDGKAQKYFTLFATHQGGIYQEVDSLTSGTTYRFSIYAYVWSSSFEDIDVSEDPGDVVVRVGIDPNGGTDGASEDVIWSTAATFFYDAYRQYAVIATAESASVTVFVESTVGEPRANTYIYLDDAVLEVASETVVVVEHTPTPETNTGLVNDTATPTPSPSPTEDAQQGGATGQEGGSEPQDATATPTATLTPTATATATATPLPIPATEEATATESGEFPDTVVHIVVAEDTVSGLALQYGSTVDAIRRANDLDESSLIVVGQRLIIPVNLPPASAVAATGTPDSTFTPAPTLTPTSTPTSTPTITPSPTATPITYQIQPGDTLVNIAQQYGTTVDLLVAANNIPNPDQISVGQILLIPTAIPPTPAGNLRPTVTLFPTDGPTLDPAVATAAPPWYTIYVVQVGDTLDEIAREHGTTVQALVELNDIADPGRIDPGQEIKIPSPYPTPTLTPTATPQPTFTPLPTDFPVTYTVQTGDTLYIIAARYGVSVVELAQLNGITDYENLTVGQVLTIPS
ncbi:MAG: LysM peptidoglycan-binding domain-containing protein [Chloroflexi bacterium]|nr:LysM peptidoglycan-binding domain-containing protein [Chloroflexota bacterium]